VQFVILQTVPLSVDNSESCRALVDICYAVIKMLLEFGTHSLGMKPEIDKARNS
jgi:hypothetical protein